MDKDPVRLQQVHTQKTMDLVLFHGCLPSLSNGDGMITDIFRHFPSITRRQQRQKSVSTPVPGRERLQRGREEEEDLLLVQSPTNDTHNRQWTGVFWSELMMDRGVDRMNPTNPIGERNSGSVDCQQEDVTFVPLDWTELGFNQQVLDTLWFAHTAGTLCQRIAGEGLSNGTGVVADIRTNGFKRRAMP